MMMSMPKTIRFIIAVFLNILCFFFDAAELLWALFLDMLFWFFEHLPYILAIAAIVLAVYGFFSCGAAYQQHMQVLALRL